MALNDFTTEIRVHPGYDYRDDPSGTRGAHNLSLDFILRGPEGAINWTLNTGWLHRPLAGAMVRGRTPDRRDKPGADARLYDLYPSAGGVSSHLHDKREEYMLGPNPCNIIGGSCYGDTGYTIGDEVLEAMFVGGHEAVWTKLREIYTAWIEQADA